MKLSSVFVKNILTRFSEKGPVDFVLLSIKRSLKKVIDLDILLVTLRDLSEPIVRVNNPLKIEHELLDAGRIEEIIGGRYEFEREGLFKNIDETHKVLRERLLDRKIVCISLVNNKIVGWKWIDFELYSIPENDIELKLSNKHVHIFDVYTVPSCRGKLIQPSSSEYVFRNLRAQGIKTCLGNVSFENLPSIKAQKKSGWTELGSIYYVGFKNKRRFFISSQLKNNARFREAVVL